MKEQLKFLALLTGIMLSQCWAATQHFESDSLVDNTAVARVPATDMNYTHTSVGGVVAALTVTSNLTTLPDQSIGQISTSAGGVAIAISYNGVVNTLRKDSRLSFMGPGSHVYNDTSTFVGPISPKDRAYILLKGPGTVTLPNSPTGNIYIESLIDTASLTCATAGVFNWNIVPTRKLTLGANITSLSGLVKKGCGTIAVNIACTTISSVFDKDFEGTLITGGAASTITNPVGCKGALFLNGAVNHTLTNAGNIGKLLALVDGGTLSTSANLVIEELDLTNGNGITFIPASGTIITIKSIVKGSSGAITLGNGANCGSIFCKKGNTTGGITALAGLASLELP